MGILQDAGHWQTSWVQTFNLAATATRHLLVGFDGVNYNVADVNAAGELAIQGGGGGGGGDVNLTEVGGVAIDLGQEAMTASIPVAIASDQSAVPVSGDWATETTLTTLNAKLVSGTTIGDVRITDGTDVVGVTALAQLLVSATCSGTATIDGPAGGVPVFVGGRYHSAPAAVDADGDLTAIRTTDLGEALVQENGPALTALQLIDDIVFFDDATFTPGSSKVAAMGATYRAAVDPVDANDIGALHMTQNRALHVNLRNASGNPITLADDAVFNAASHLMPAGFVVGTGGSTPTNGDVAAARVTTTRALHTNLRSANGTELGTSGNPVRTDPTGTTTQTVAPVLTVLETARGSIAGASLTSSYADIVTNGTPKDIDLIRIWNYTDANCIVLLDSDVSTTEHDLPPGAFWEMDFVVLNKTRPNGDVRVKHDGTAPNNGKSVYCTVVYQG